MQDTWYIFYVGIWWHFSEMSAESKLCDPKINHYVLKFELLRMIPVPTLVPLKVIQIPIKFFTWRLGTLNCHLSEMHCTWLHYTPDRWVIAAAACCNDLKNASDDSDNIHIIIFLDLHRLLNAAVVSLRRFVYYLSTPLKVLSMDNQP